MLWEARAKDCPGNDRSTAQKVTPASEWAPCLKALLAPPLKGVHYLGACPAHGCSGSLRLRESRDFQPDAAAGPNCHQELGIRLRASQIGPPIWVCMCSGTRVSVQYRIAPCVACRYRITLPGADRPRQVSLDCHRGFQSHSRCCSGGARHVRCVTGRGWRCLGSPVFSPNRLGGP